MGMVATRNRACQEKACPLCLPGPFAHRSGRRLYSPGQFQATLNTQRGRSRAPNLSRPPHPTSAAPGPRWYAGDVGRGSGMSRVGSSACRVGHDQPSRTRQRAPSLKFLTRPSADGHPPDQGRFRRITQTWSKGWAPCDPRHSEGPSPSPPHEVGRVEEYTPYL